MTKSELKAKILKDYMDGVSDCTCQECKVTHDFLESAIDQAYEAGCNRMQRNIKAAGESIDELLSIFP